MSECTIELPGGRFCDAPGIPDAPFPICRKHATEVYRYMHEGLRREVDSAARALFAGRPVAGQPKPPRPSVIYYAREPGGTIKIGFTKQAATDRLAQLRIDADALLATEPGTMQLERQRHQQFAHLRVGKRESFRPEPELLAHIAQLTQHAANART